MKRSAIILTTLLLSTPAFAGHSESINSIHSPELRAKVAEIQAACGSHIVSAWRGGSHTPSGHLSNHARHLAVDLKGNPSCIYAHLHGWPGGYSTDYSAVQHVHISYSHAMEWGLRFRHAGSSHTFHARSHRHHHLDANGNHVASYSSGMGSY